MKKIRIAAVVAAGSLAALGIAGTALADNGADDPTPHASATASASPSPIVSESAGPATTGVGIGVEAAKRIAVEAAGGGRIAKVEGEVEHGRAVWSVDVIVGGVEHDVDVDKVTGSVLRHRIKGAGTATPTATTTPRATATPKATATTRGGDNRTPEPGDDRDNRTAEPGDDHGGHGNEAGDDHGRHGGGNDDSGTDDRGGKGHGSDD